MKLTATTIDADDVGAMAAFWSAAFDTPVEGKPEDGYLFVGAEGDPNRLCIQHTDDPKREKNRWHFDFESADRPAEVARLLDLGANKHGEHDDWTVLTDVEGNQFCVF